jgi:hypothetical protein
MLLKIGEKIHLIHRRRFDRDVRRHFVGSVEDYELGLARLHGYTFVTDDLNKHEFVRRPDLRTKIAALASGEFIVNVLPPEVDLEKVRYEQRERRLIVTDGQWEMDIKEFGWG